MAAVLFGVVEVWLRQGDAKTARTGGVRLRLH
jgi:hypothetical protein